jgi:hypothetical protein
MSYPALPDPGTGTDPATDPTAFVRDVLVRYFRPGLVDSVIRTWVPVGLGSALSWVSLNYEWLGLPAKPSATLSLTVTGLVLAAYYLVARIVERKFPKVGRLLLALNLTKARPTYAEPDAATAVESAAATPDPTRR